jgi:hypothetical protein
LGTGKAADDDELMRELKCGAGDFYAMLGQLTEDGVVVEDGTGVRLSESCNAVA